MKKVGKKFCAFLMASLMAVSAVFTLALAETKPAAVEAATVADVDSILTEAIGSLNGKMEENGGYAKVGDLKDGAAVVTISKSSQTVQSIREDVVGTIFGVLLKHKDTLKSVQGYKDGALNTDAAAKLDLATVQQTDTAAINAFVKSFGLGLTADGTIGDLVGKSVKMDVTTAKDETGTYTFTFEAEAKTSKAVDDIVADGIKSLNEKMAQSGSYARMSDLKDGAAVVTIRKTGEKIQEIREDIVGTIFGVVLKYQETLATVQGYKDGVLNTDPAATIDLKTIKQTDTAAINAFVQSFGLGLKEDGTLADLVGKSVKMDVTTAAGETGTYTVTFEKGFVANLDSGDHTVTELEGVGTILTGDSLKNENNASQAKTVEEVKELFAAEDGVEVKVVTSEDKDVEAGQRVGTGCKVQLIKDGQVIDEITIVVAGDLDGEGTISSSDAVKILNSLGGEALTGVYLQAALLTEAAKESGQPTSSDAVMILNIAASAEAAE